MHARKACLPVVCTRSPCGMQCSARTFALACVCNNSTLILNYCDVVTAHAWWHWHTLTTHIAPQVSLLTRDQPVTHGSNRERSSTILGFHVLSTILLFSSSGLGITLNAITLLLDFASHGVRDKLRLIYIGQKAGAHMALLREFDATFAVLTYASHVHVLHSGNGAETKRIVLCDCLKSAASGLHAPTQINYPGLHCITMEPVENRRWGIATVTTIYCHTEMTHGLPGCPLGGVPSRSQAHFSRPMTGHLQIHKLFNRKLFRNMNCSAKTRS